MKLANNVTTKIAEYSTALKYEDLPKEVIHETKRVFMDIVGCGLGSSDLDKGANAVKIIRELGGSPQATILGSGEKVSVTSATFANAELMHSMDYNAITPPIYIAPFVCPAALAVGEMNNVSGKEFLAAMAAGFDVASRIGLALGSFRDKSKPVKSYGTGFDTFGVAVAAGKLMGFDSYKMADALGLAGYFAPVPCHTKYMNTPNNGMMKFGAAGWTAQAGVTAALLSNVGEAGDRSVLDGDYGFWAMNGSQSCDFDSITANLGKDWKILQSKFKSLPCDGIYQSPLRPLIDLIAENNLKPEDMDYVLVKAEANMFCPQFMSTTIENNVDASMSFPFCVAVVACGVPVGPIWQRCSTYTDPKILDFMNTKVKFEVYDYAEETRKQEIEVEHKPYINRRPSYVEVSAHGKVYSRKAEYAYWLSAETPEYTAKDSDLIEKFHGNTADVMTREKSEKAVEMLMNLEKVASIKDLMKALTW